MESEAECRVQFEALGEAVVSSPGESLLGLARRAGLEIVSLCGGRGDCGRCRVRLLAGEASPVTPGEAQALDAPSLAGGFRLACQARPLSDCRVLVPGEALSAARRAQVESLEGPAAEDPPVRAWPLDLVPGVPAGADSLLKMVQEQHHLRCRTVDPEALRQLPLMGHRQHVRVSVRGDEVVAFGPWPGAQLGLAVDVGTTRIAGYLVDLDRGATLAARGLLNPQSAWGEDIITRLANATDLSSHWRRLQQMVIEALNGLSAGLSAEAGASPGDIVEAVLVGNTAMHHLALGLPVDRLLRPPFAPVVAGPLEVKGRDLGLRIAPGAYVHSLPNVSGFVGADHVAMLLATRALWDGRTALAIDLGTNTEISLISREQVACVSCASGPAFEGGHIRHGMAAGAGAIERLRITRDGVEYQTVGGAPPVGICGSGIIDAVAGLYSAGIINASGRLQERPGVRVARGEREFVLVDGKEGGAAPALAITQHDVREIQLAKGAVRAGIEVLLRSKGAGMADVEAVILAGAFGTYLDPASAAVIGMLPDLPPERFRQVGNAAGAGARMALVSTARRREAADLARRMEYIELAAAPRFMEIFARATRLGPGEWRD